MRSLQLFALILVVVYISISRVRSDSVKVNVHRRAHIKRDATVCPKGFVYLSDAKGCYKIVTGAMSWPSAQSRCLEFSPKASLAVIQNKEQSDAIQAYLKTLSSADTSACKSSFLTSGQRQVPNDCKSGFVWKPTPNVEIPLTYKRWAGGEPNCGGKTESCLQYWGDASFNWNDIDCSNAGCPICQYTDKNECFSSPCQNGGTCVELVSGYYCKCADGFYGESCKIVCPTGFVYLPNAGCYRTVFEGLNFDDSRDRCLDFSPKARLVVIETPQQGDAIQSYLSSLPAAKTTPCVQESYKGISFYSSGQRIIDGECNSPFVWKPEANARIPMLSAYWGGTEPDCSKRSDRPLKDSCAIFHSSNNRLNDVPCEARGCPVCQYTDKNDCASAPCQNGGKCSDLLVEYYCNCKDNYYGKHCEIFCPAGFVYLSGANGCYKTVLEGLSWSSAQSRCREINPKAKLAVIQNKDQDDAITVHLKTLSATELLTCPTSFLTSGQRVKPEQCSSGFVWKPEPNVTIPLTYTSWVTGQPDCSAGSEGCLHFWKDQSYNWNDVSCATARCPLCQYTAKDECSSSPCQNGGTCTELIDSYYCSCIAGYNGDRCEIGCPDGFVFLPKAKGCYKAVLDSLWWGEARDNCQKLAPGAHLAIVDNKDEQDDITTYLKSIKATQTFYTAGRKKIPGDCTSPFVWEPTSESQYPMTYTAWAAGSPDCYKGNNLATESCITFLGNVGYLWNDVPCESSACSVCEVGGAAVVDYCKPDSCQNGGVCISDLNSFSCVCKPGFTGDRCEKSVKINYCSPNPCKNGGKCATGVEGYSYYCYCAPGFGGDNCKDTINYCDPNPCLNGGQCQAGDENYSYYCYCAPGFGGDGCKDALTPRKLV